MNDAVSSYSLPLSVLAKSPECRFDAGHYNPELLHTLNTLKQSGLKLERLSTLVKRVILPSRFKRIFVKPEAGLPFLQGSHVVHFQPADLKYLSPASHKDIDVITIRAGWLLITRSGTVGRVTLCPSEWDGWVASEHIIRIIPDEAKCPAGYLCSFLALPFGQIQLRANIHGAVVDELTDKQVENVLVPIPKKKKDWNRLRSIDASMKHAIALKSQAVTAAHASVASTSAWLHTADDSIVHQDKDLRIPNATPEQVAKTLMSGGATPRPDTKRRKAS